MKHLTGILIVAAALVAPWGRSGGPMVDVVSAATSKSVSEMTTADLDKFYEDIFTRADHAGRLVMLVYWQPKATPKARRAKSILMTRTARSVTQQFILRSIEIVGKDKHGPGYRGKANGSETPIWVLLKPNGEFLDGGDYDTVGPKGKGGWYKTVSEIARDHPPTSKKTRAQIARLLRRANTDLEKKHYDKAEPALWKLKKVWYPPELAEQCEQFCEKMQSHIDDLNDNVEELLTEEDFLGAALAYQKIIDTFKPRTKTGKDAQAKLTELLREHPKMRVKFNKIRSGEIDPADVIGQTNDDEKGVDETDIDDEMDSGDDAGDATDDDGGDDDADKADNKPADDKEAKARSLIGVAKLYKGNGMIDKARQKLQECIDLYGGTEAAKEAQKLLDEW